MQLVVPAVGNPVALASDLKADCKGGQADLDIQNMSDGTPGAYSQVWEALHLYFNNVVISVDAVMCEMGTRILKDGDFVATVELIKKRTLRECWNRLTT